MNGPQGYAGVLSAYNSTPGYDLVTGLGSVNIENLVNNWAVVSAATQATTTTLAASTTLSTYGQPVTLSGAVTPVSGSGRVIAIVGRAVKWSIVIHASLAACFPLLPLWPRVALATSCSM